jgi:hypothetical protein
MKRLSPSVPVQRSRAVAPVLLLLVAPAVLARCIPNPDISGLPPYDGGSYSFDSSFSYDAGGFTGDATTFSEDAGIEASAADGGVQLGGVNGIVIDYTQGVAQGIVPGATITVTPAGSTTAIAQQTSDANGLFAVANLPSGVPLQVNVTKPTDETKGVAYSSTAIVVTIPAGQTVSLAPVLNEGCFQIVNVLSAGDAGVTLQNATCPGGFYGVSGPGQRPGAYAAMTFETSSFKDTMGTYLGQVRIEMIPLAYPLSDPADPPDLSWAVGLPGGGSPAGLLGAAEYRVVREDTGEVLDVADSKNDPVSIAVPVFTAPTGQPAAYSYDEANQTWKAETSAVTGPAQVYSYGSPTFDETLQLSYVMVQVPHLTWWAATSAAGAVTTCVTGSVQAGGPLANVVVRAAGANYLGASTAITDATGTFCLDLAAGTFDAGLPMGTIYAEALSGGAPYAASQAFSASAQAGGSCASQTGCTAIGPITLSPSLTCVTGSLTYDEEGGAPSALDELLVNLSDYGSDQGIQQTAYVGETTVGDAGTFCALAPPGGSLRLVQPGNLICTAPHDVNSYQVPTGAGAPTCGGSGCQDAGALLFSCSGG